MKSLRSSPFRSFLDAWALHDFMRACCEACFSDAVLSLSCASAPDIANMAAISNALIRIITASDEVSLEGGARKGPLPCQALAHDSARLPVRNLPLVGHGSRPSTGKPQRRG